MHRLMLVAVTAAAIAGPLATANAAAVNGAMPASSITRTVDTTGYVPYSAAQLQTEVQMLQNQVRQLQDQNQVQDNASAAQLNQIGVGG
jgi:hypothetical protein